MLVGAVVVGRVRLGASRTTHATDAGGPPVGGLQRREHADELLFRVEGQNSSEHVQDLDVLVLETHVATGPAEDGVDLIGRVLLEYGDDVGRKGTLLESGHPVAQRVETLRAQGVALVEAGHDPVHVRLRRAGCLVVRLGGGDGVGRRDRVGGGVVRLGGGRLVAPIVAGLVGVRLGGGCRDGAVVSVLVRIDVECLGLREGRVGLRVVLGLLGGEAGLPLRDGEVELPSGPHELLDTQGVLGVFRGEPHRRTSLREPRRDDGAEVLLLGAELVDVDVGGHGVLLPSEVYRASP